MTIRKRHRRFEMRDIRDDLRERLAEADAHAASDQLRYDMERQRLDAEFHETKAANSRTRSMLQDLLDAEIVKWGALPGEPIEQPIIERPKPRVPLMEFLIRTVYVRGEMAKDDLRQRAQYAGYFGDDSGGRITHTTLLNLVNGNRLRKLPNGNYAYPEKGLSPEAHRLLGVSSNGADRDQLQMNEAPADFSAETS